jgi:uncharacterized protein YeaC (DUF1315 family)
MIENITPDIYESLKLAVEIGKWSDGRKLTAEQRELSLQAMIAWEIQNLPEDQRTGYMGPQECASKSRRCQHPVQVGCGPLIELARGSLSKMSARLEAPVVQYSFAWTTPRCRSTR